MSELSQPNRPDGKSELDVSDLKQPPVGSHDYTYKNPLPRARAVYITLGIYLGSVLVCSFVTFIEIGLLYLDIQSKPTPLYLWDATDQFWVYYDPVSTWIYLLAVIPFAIWFYRVAANAWTINPRGMRWSAGMCVGWYFVPIANLFRPYQATRDVDTISSSHGHFSAKRFMSWWWSLWLITAWVGQAFQAAWHSLESSEEFLNANIYYQGFILLETVLTILALLLVRRITTAQRMHHDSLDLPPRKPAPNVRDLRQSPRPLS